MLQKGPRTRDRLIWSHWHLVPKYMTRKNRPFWSFFILTRAKKTDFGDLWWSWVWKSLMKGNSAAFLYYLVLIWTKHSKAIVPQKTTTIIFAPRVNNWFWRRLICIHYTYVAYICCLNHGSWLFLCVFPSGWPSGGRILEAWLQIHLLAPVARSRAGGHLDLRGGLQVLAVMA